MTTQAPVAVGTTAANISAPLADDGDWIAQNVGRRVIWYCSHTDPTASGANVAWHRCEPLAFFTFDTTTADPTENVEASDPVWVRTDEGESELAISLNG